MLGFLGNLVSFLAGMTIAVIILAFQPRRKSLTEQLQQFTSWKPQIKTVQRKKLLSTLAGYTPKEWGKSRNLELTRAKIPMNGGEFLILQIIIAGMLSLFGVLITRRFSTGIVSWILGWMVPLWYLHHARNKQLNIFNGQLADALTMMANGLKSGFSFTQAMDMASREMPAPLSTEWGITLKEMQLGASTELALDHLAERVGSTDLDLMTTAILIQRQVGGNLSEVLSNIHDTIQDRLRIKNEIQTLTAQGRISGYMISALPFVIALVLFFINPSYLALLISKPLGWEMIGAGLVSQAIGFSIIRKIVNIKV